jgi:putative sigma-54 modulation protein
MRVTIKAKTSDIPVGLREYAEKKVKKLGKYFRKVKSAEVVQSEERNWQIAEVTLEGDGVTFRGKEKSDDMRASVDNVVLKLEQQLKKHKGRLIDRNRGSAEARTRAPAVDDDDEVSYDDDQPRIVKTKRIEMSPMSAEEACMQMDMLGHSFFVFQNEDTLQISAVYKRDDGDYGLIEPEA